MSVASAPHSGGFIGFFITVGSGRAVGQIAMIGAAPILSRIYTPADYGVSALAQSIVMILLYVSTLRYEAVIMTVRGELARANAYGLCLAILTTTAAVVALALATGWALETTGLISTNLFNLILFFAPPLLVVNVMHSFVTPHVLIKKGALGLVSLGGVCNGVVGASAQIGLGLAGLGAAGLLTGRILGYLSSVLVMTVPKWRSIFRPYFAGLRIRRMRAVASAHADQALFLAPAGLLNALSTQSPIFFLSAWYGNAATGSYFFAHALLGAGLLVYRSTIGPVTLSQASKLRNAGQPVMPFILKVTGVVGALGIAGAAALFLTAERLVPIIFGDEWTDAGVVVAWLGIFFAMSSIHLPASSLSTLFRFQRIMLATQIAQVAGVAAALAIGLPSGDYEATVAGIAVVGAAIYALSLAVIIAAIRAADRAAPLSR